MPQRHRALGLFLLLPSLTLTALCAALPAAAQDRSEALDLAEEADLHFRIGVDFYRQGRFREALEHLLLSNRLVPNKNVGFNIARTYEQLGDYAQAYRHYADYVALETDASRRAAGEEALNRIKGRVALLRVITEPEGATIYVDRRDLGARGTSPRSLALEPGSHVILAEAPGYEPGESKPAEIRVGEESVVVLKLRQILGELNLSGSPEGATVHLDTEDGPVVGTLPGTLALPAGTHVLAITAPGYQTRMEMFTIAPRETTQAAVNLDLVTGTLVVDTALRGALIEIDGVSAGFTPAVLPSVASGTHTLRVTLPGYRAFEQTIQIEPNGQTKVNARLRSLQEVTAASRTAESIEDAPASVTLISQEEIRAFGYETVYQALGGTRGVFQTNDLTYQYLGFRGFSRLGDYGNRVLVTLDGHTMNDDQLGSSYVGYDLMSDLMDVERIEVVRGPGSALYGTNAFFGVVNLVTRERESMRAPHVSLAADGSRTARFRAGVGARNGDKLGVWVSAGGVLSQGRDYSFPEFNDAFGDATTGDLSQSLDADGARAATVATKAWAYDLTVQGLVNVREKRISTGAYGTVLGSEDATSTDTRGFLEIRYEPRFGEKLQLYSRVYLDRYAYEGDYPYDDDQDLPYEDEEIGTVVDAWDGAWVGAEPRLVATPTEWLSVTAGAELRAHYLAHITSEDASGVYLDEDVPYQVYSGYAVADLTPGDWLSASVGARLDAFSSFGLSVNPRFALVAKPDTSDIIKLMGGRAYRAPSPYELNYNDEGYSQIAPDNLEPELVYTGELEYTRKFSEVTSLVGSAYYNRISNLIDTIETTSDESGEELDVLQYANTESQVQTVGFEAEARRDWREGWMLSASYSLQHTREGSLIDGDPLSNSPAHLGAVKFAAPLSNGGPTVSTRLGVESGRLTVAEEMTDPAILWDMTVAGQIPAMNFDYALGVRNALDWKIAHPGNYDYLQDTLPQAGRTLFASVTFEL